MARLGDRSRFQRERDQQRAEELKDKLTRVKFGSGSGDLVGYAKMKGEQLRQIMADAEVDSYQKTIEIGGAKIHFRGSPLGNGQMTSITVERPKPIEEEKPLEVEAPEGQAPVGEVEQVEGEEVETKLEEPVEVEFFAGTQLAQQWTFRDKGGNYYLYVYVPVTNLANLDIDLRDNKKEEILRGVQNGEYPFTIRGDLGSPPAFTEYHVGGGNLSVRRTSCSYYAAADGDGYWGTINSTRYNPSYWNYAAAGEYLALGFAVPGSDVSSLDDTTTVTTYDGYDTFDEAAGTSTWPLQERYLIGNAWENGVEDVQRTREYSGTNVTRNTHNWSPIKEDFYKRNSSYCNAYIDTTAGLLTLNQDFPSADLTTPAGSDYAWNTYLNITTNPANFYSFDPTDIQWVSGWGQATGYYRWPSIIAPPSWTRPLFGGAGADFSFLTVRALAGRRKDGTGLFSYVGITRKISMDYICWYWPDWSDLDSSSYGTDSAPIGGDKRWDIANTNPWYYGGFSKGRNAAYAFAPWLLCERGPEFPLSDPNDPDTFACDTTNPACPAGEYKFTSLWWVNAGSYGVDTSACFDPTDDWRYPNSMDYFSSDVEYPYGGIARYCHTTWFESKQRMTFVNENDEATTVNVRIIQADNGVNIPDPAYLNGDSTRGMYGVGSPAPYTLYSSWPADLGVGTPMYVNNADSEGDTVDWAVKRAGQIDATSLPTEHPLQAIDATNMYVTGAAYIFLIQNDESILERFAYQMDTSDLLL